MKRTRFSAWLVYAGAALGLTVVLAVAVSAVVRGPDARAIWVAAGVAYTLQLIAFALLVALRQNAQLFLFAWVAGLLLRFGVLGVGAYVLSATGVLPLSETLLSYAGFVFVMLLLEPLFLRWDLRGQ